MQEQNFEKQVQFKLDELSLTPSAPVWQKVEQEIRQKKRRRRVIVFWLFASLITGGGAFWGVYTAMDYKNKSISAVTTTEAIYNQTNPATNQRGTSSQKEHTPIKSNNLPTTKEETIFQRSTTTTIPTTGNSRAAITFEQSGVTTKQSTEKKTALVRATIKQQAPSPKRLSNASKNKRKERKATPFISGDLVMKSIKGNTDEQQPATQQTTNGSTQSTANDTTITKTQPIETTAQPIISEATPAIDSSQANKGKKKGSKWTWSAQAAFGVSSLQTGLLSKSSRAPETFSQPVGNSGFPPATPMPVASKIESGYSLHLNFTAHRSVTKRLSVTGALQYSYFSTRNQVGQAVTKDTSVRSIDNSLADINQYYRNTQNGPTKEFINNYHFIELPIGVEWQIFRRFPLKWQSGISVSYLVRSNALVHDRVADIYYHNNDLLRRTQAHFFTGLDYRVLMLGKRGIHSGPYLQFGLSGLRKEGNNYHLLSTGIKTRVSF